jgi:hypothetical protein
LLRAIHRHQGPARGKMENSPGKIIHAARTMQKNAVCYLLLRQTGEQHFCWFEMHASLEETETTISAQTIEEALRLARQHWSLLAFRTVNCGFRYTLPERDEHGMNALFHQMAASYSSMNGVYFDPDMGNNCFVNFASDEARSLWKTLKEAKKL